MTAEDKEDRFKRLATARTNAVLEKLRILGNLSNRHVYEYSPEDIERMFVAISRQVRLTRARFETDKQQRFNLK